jgi:tetratricopeptide (TPR) repeat protein
MKMQEVADVAETLRNARGRDKCALLIGAGCSVTAGIPTAPGIAAEAQSLCPRACSRTADKDYPHVMAALSPDERRSIIGKYVDNANVNWAHVCIAQLMNEGYVDRILTTNFDPLVIWASALVGRSPAVYDLAGSSTFDPERIASPAVLHLHGQRSGFVMLNTPEQVREHACHVKPAIVEAGTKRTWLVVGYSGSNDAVFGNLAQLGEFNSRLYWVTYRNEEPPRHVKEQLLDVRQFAFWVGGFDADEFFVTLLRELDCFPPRFIGRPFTHLREQIGNVAPYAPTKDSSPDFTGPALVRIDRAIAKYENTTEATEDREAQELLLAGRLEDLAKMAAGARVPAGVAEAGAWGYVLTGSRWSAEATTKTNTEADDLYKAAYEEFARALAIKPDMYEALNNWGSALSEQAETKTGKKADGLFKAAYEKYARALAIKPDKHEALYNWGTAQLEQAKAKTGEEAEGLRKAAYEKYAQVLAIKPDKHEALYNWGNALSEQAKAQTGKEADGLFKAAYEKYAQALAIKPDKHEALYNWGTTLLEQAKAQTGKEAEGLRKAAGEKYAQALAIKPDKHEALSNWGNALSQRARAQTGKEADGLFKAAYEKYAQALAIKPDDYRALSNWGAALSDQAAAKTGKEAGGLFKAAYDKYAQALAIEPENYEALSNWGATLLEQAKAKTGEEAEGLHARARAVLLSAEALSPGTAAYNLACVCALEADPDGCRQWLRAAKKAGHLPKREHLLKDPDLEVVRKESWFGEILR